MVGSWYMTKGVAIKQSEVKNTMAGQFWPLYVFCDESFSCEARHFLFRCWIIFWSSEEKEKAWFGGVHWEAWLHRRPGSPRGILMACCYSTYCSTMLYVFAHINCLCVNHSLLSTSRWKADKFKPTCFSLSPVVSVFISLEIRIDEILTYPCDMRERRQHGLELCVCVCVCVSWSVVFFTRIVLNSVVHSSLATQGKRMKSILSCHGWATVLSTWVTTKREWRFYIARIPPPNTQRLLAHTS